MCLVRVMSNTALAEENARLKARLAETEAALADAVEAQKRLESIVSELRREKFGGNPKSLIRNSSTCRSRMWNSRRACWKRRRRKRGAH